MLVLSPVFGLFPVGVLPEGDLVFLDLFYDLDHLGFSVFVFKADLFFFAA